MRELKERIVALFRGDFHCSWYGHEWDIAAHGPEGSIFVCLNCPAKMGTSIKGITYRDKG